MVADITIVIDDDNVEDEDDGGPVVVVIESADVTAIIGDAADSKYLTSSSMSLLSISCNMSLVVAQPRVVVLIEHNNY